MPIELCSSCLKHEVSSWINERVNELNSKAKEKIIEELKSIRLKEGICIVCNKNQTTDNSFINILKILEKTRAENMIIYEFARMFGYKNGKDSGEFFNSLFN